MYSNQLILFVYPKDHGTFILHRVRQLHIKTKPTMDQSSSCYFLIRLQFHTFLTDNFFFENSNKNEYICWLDQVIAAFCLVMKWRVKPQFVLVRSTRKEHSFNVVSVSLFLLYSKSHQLSQFILPLQMIHTYPIYTCYNMQSVSGSLYLYLDSPCCFRVGKTINTDPKKQCDKQT